MSDSKQYDPPRPSTALSDEDVDSTATTLLANSPSSKSSSFDKGIETRHRYEDIDFGREERRRSKADDADEDDDELAEDAHLLADETAALNTNKAALETARDVDGDEPPPPPPANASSIEPAKGEKRQYVSWSSLPKKSQLAILTLARLSEPLTQTSLQAYMFYQLKSFHEPGAKPPSDAVVARQAGLLAAAFTGAQFCVAMLWGRLADSERFGRKRVILIGLMGTTIGSLGFGFSSSFASAVFWRCIGGMLNGNVGVMRTMISETVKEKKYQSRAFLLLPMTFNIGVIIGPLLGGLLADPVGSYPGIFGPGGSIGGKAGVWWLMRWPYALPNVVTATFLSASALGVILGLEETLEGLRDRPDYGLKIGRWIARTVFRRKKTQQYVSLHDNGTTADDIELHAGRQTPPKPKAAPRQRLAFRRIFTRNLITTLIAHSLLAFHVGTFNNLWFVFLSTPRYNPSSSSTSDDTKYLYVPTNYHPHLPFTFTGGLALPPPSIGASLAILGVIGISLQLLLYPRLSFRLGTRASFRYALCLFPIAYTLAPFLATIHSSSAPPGQASGVLVWMGIACVLAVQVCARTFALPSSAIIVNNASPHPSVLGTVHGLAQSASSATRTLGPVLAGWLYGVGLSKGVVGLAWWCMAGAAVVGAVAGRWVKEGDGHEIWLPGEREEVEEEERRKGGDGSSG